MTLTDALEKLKAAIPDAYIRIYVEAAWSKATEKNVYETRIVYDGVNGMLQRVEAPSLAATVELAIKHHEVSQRVWQEIEA